MYKKILLVLVSFLILIGLGYNRLKSFKSPNPAYLPSKEEETNNKAQLVIDFGGAEIKSFNETLVGETTVFELLKTIADREKFALEFKEYDFGVLIQSIEGRSNTTDLSWIYFVNGKVAEVGADKYLIKPGDVIEWKYIKPTF